MSPRTVWELAIAVGVVALGMGECHARDQRREADAVAQQQVRDAQRQRDRARESAVQALIARDQALDAARDTARVYQRRLAAIPRPIAAIGAIPPAHDSLSLLPADSIVVRTDSATWNEYQRRFDAYPTLYAIASDGLPAVAKQYEASLTAADSAIASLRRADSLAQAQATLWEGIAKRNRPTVWRRVQQIGLLAGVGYVAFHVGKGAR